MKYLALFSILSGCLAAAEPAWQPLFNGKNLDGWKPKFRGCEFGENHKDIFRVRNGAICVDYSNCQDWDGSFGHLFYHKKFSHYRLRAEYRFTGGQARGGPGWAFRNSGIMIHSEAPEMMELNQDFPTSLEVQLLGGPEKGERSTGNLCTPGTHVEFAGKADTRHCISSTSATYPGDQWVTIEVEARGGEVIKHFINGKEVISYAGPVLGGDAHADALAKVAGSRLITGGYICLQAESHPVEFRKIEIQILEP